MIALDEQSIYPGDQCFGCAPDDAEGLRSESFPQEGGVQFAALVPHAKCPPADHRGTRAAGLNRLPDHYLRPFGVVS